jgi:hypothetical protein
MKMTPEHISDLLAHRDGERLDPQRAVEIEASAEHRSELAVLRQLKHELNELPSVVPPAEAWAQIQARTSKRPSSFARFTQRFPVAMAATIALAAMLGIVVWDPANLQSQRPGGSPLPVADLSAVATGSQANRYAALVNRSQQLESALLYRPGASVTWSEDQQALLYRIADLDSELNAAPAGELPSLDSRERLWEQRVLLLESLAQSRRVSAQSAVF